MKGRSGFTLVELMVALGLTVVLLAAVAEVFGISSRVVSAALVQSSFYTRLAAAHAWMADEITFEDYSAGTDFTTRWGVTDVDSNSAGVLALTGAPEGEGILMEGVSSFEFHGDYQPPYSDYEAHRLYRFDMAVFYCSRRSDIVPDGPEKTQTAEMSLYFAGNTSY